MIRKGCTGGITRCIHRVFRERSGVLGYGNDLLGVEDEITIEHAVVLLARYADYIGIDTDATLDLFYNADEVADWAAEQMKWAVDNRIFEGIDNELNPQNPAKDGYSQKY